MLRSVGWTVPYLMVGMILLGGAAVLLGRQSGTRFNRGCVLEDEGRLVDAIEQYEWAVRAYTPFSNTPNQALERLERIACDAEVKQDTGTAIQAWQAIVSGLAVVENVEQPYSEVLATAEIRLEALRNKQKQDKDPPEG